MTGQRPSGIMIWGVFSTTGPSQLLTVLKGTKVKVPIKRVEAVVEAHLYPGLAAKGTLATGLSRVCTVSQIGVIAF